MTCQNLDLEIKQGSTFALALKWGSGPILFVPIQGISQGAPAVVSATAHGLPAGWPVSVESVKGMTEINAANSPPLASDYKQITVINANSLSLDGVNSFDFHAYKSGGVLRTYTPISLAGYTARMKIKDRVGGTVLANLVSPTNITIDDVNKTITITIAASATEVFTFVKAVYDLELVSAGGVVTRIAEGKAKLDQEVTTP